MLSQRPASSSTTVILTAASAAGVAAAPAKPRVVELLTYNQTELLKLAKVAFDGECVGFSSFWLCLHMFNPLKTIDELVAAEPKKLQAMKENLNDILLLSKHLGSDIKISKTSAPVSTIGVKAFCKLDADAIFEPGPKKRFPFDDCDVEPEPLDVRARIFVDAVHSVLEQKGTDKRYINFSYCWMDGDEPAAGDMVHPQTYKRIQGHSIAFIKNPTADCELLFFDCNHYAYAFSKAADFYKFAQDYFKAVLGRDRIPESYYTSVAKNIPLKQAAAVPAAVVAAPAIVSPAAK